MTRPKTVKVIAIYCINILMYFLMAKDFHIPFPEDARDVLFSNRSTSEVTLVLLAMHAWKQAAMQLAALAARALG